MLEGPFLCLLSLLPFWMPLPPPNWSEKPLPLDLLKRAISPSFCRLQASPEAECRLKPWRLSPRATQAQDRAGCRVSQSSFPPPVPQLLWDPGLLEFGQLVTEPSLRRASPRQRPPGHWSRLRNCRGRGPPDLAARWPGLPCGVLTVNWSPPLVSRQGPCSGTA